MSSSFPSNSFHHGGFEPFPSLLEPPNPKISPTSPIGFGTGHSLFCLLKPTSSISSLLSSMALKIIGYVRELNINFRSNLKKENRTNNLEL